MRSLLQLAFAACLLLAAAASSLASEGGDGFLLDEADVREITASELVAQPARFAFPRGERLEYSIRYLGMPVATASLEVTRFIEWRGRRFAHVVGVGDTNDFFSAFYPIHDRTEAWIDLDTLRTHRTSTWTRHGRDKETHERTDFDWDAHFIRMVEDKKHRSRRREVGFDFGPFVHDTFDAFYAIRGLDLDEGRPAVIPVYANNKVYSLKVEVNRRETIDWKGETVETMVVRPSSLLDGEPMGNGVGELHIPTEGRRAPLALDGWFETPNGFRIGGVQATLVAYDPGDIGWPVAAPARIPVKNFQVETLEGQPVWEAPPAIRQVRETRGIEPYSKKTSLDVRGEPAR